MKININPILNNKFVQDTLTEKGVYSQARVMGAIAFPIWLALGIYIVISDRLLGLKTVNIYAFQVFTTIGTFIVLIIGRNVYKDKIDLQNQIDNKVVDNNININKTE